MAGKKSYFKNRNELVNAVAKMENTTKEALVNAYRRAFKRLIELDVRVTKEGKFRSPLTMLRKEALTRAKSR